MSITSLDRSIETRGADYLALGQETADILNTLRGQGEPLVFAIERIAVLGELAFQSEKRQLYTEKGKKHQNLSIEVDLPNKGRTNRRWIQNPRLEVAEFIDGGVATLLQVNLEADAGQGYRPHSSWAPSHRLETEEVSGGLLIVPDMEGLQYSVGEIWPKHPETVEKEFKVMDALVNSLRGLIGQHETR